MHSVLYIQASSSLLLEPDPFGDDFEADLENDQEFGDRAERVYTYNTRYIHYTYTHQYTTVPCPSRTCASELKWRTVCIM
jgi:hypothetical protein